MRFLGNLSILGRATSCSISPIVLSMELSFLDVRLIAHVVDPSKFCLDSPPTASRAFTCLFCNCPFICQDSIVEYKFSPSVFVVDLLRFPKNFTYIKSCGHPLLSSGAIC